MRLAIGSCRETWSAQAGALETRFLRRKRVSGEVALALAAEPARFTPPAPPSQGGEYAPISAPPLAKRGSGGVRAQTPADALETRFLQRFRCPSRAPRYHENQLSRDRTGQSQPPKGAASYSLGRQPQERDATVRPPLYS